ncbi:12561_t:CDS:2, partial [Cetraspora pellucida]
MHYLCKVLSLDFQRRALNLSYIHALDITIGLLVREIIRSFLNGFEKADGDYEADEDNESIFK